MKVLIATVPVLAVFTTVAFARQWTDSTGKYTVEAEFLDFKDGKVRMKKDDGKTISMALERLSNADQEFVKSQVSTRVRMGDLGAIEAPAPRPPMPRPESPGGPLTMEPWNRTIVQRVFEGTGQRDKPRRHSFGASDWPGGTKFVRVEQDDVPVLGHLGLNGNTLTIEGVASRGEIFAFVGRHDLISIPNPLSSAPDQNGLWYKVELLEGKQGWIFAEPAGHQGAPLARCFALRDGHLAEIKSGSPQGRNGGTEAMDNARASGAKAGDEDGRRAGYAEGLADASKAAEERSYNGAISKLYASGDYKRVPFYTLLAIVGGILLGFGLQYAVMYIIRRCGLGGIDRIVLPKDMRHVDLNSPSLVSAPREHNGTDAEHRSLLPFIALFFVFLIGCENHEKEAYRKAYDAHYDAAKQAGRQSAEATGSKVGAEKGAASAKEAAENGRAWQLYATLAEGALICGILAGLLAQYLVLLACREPVRRFWERRNNLLRAPTLANFRLVLDCAGLGACHDLSVAFVPAMGSSVSFAILDEWQKIFKTISRAQGVRAAGFASTLDALETRRQELALAQTIEEYDRIRRRHLLVIAGAERARIVSEMDARVKKESRSP